MIRRITFFVFLFSSIVVIGQDECASAIFIGETSNWCSEVEAYNNFSATPSLLGDATCFSNAGFDVWFSFRAVASDVNITILGESENGNFGNLQSPEAALYSGTCSGSLSEYDCASNVIGNGIIELYKGGLTVGSIYYIRVRGRNSARGTFQVCINNYNPPANSNSDCSTAPVLCDKSTFTVASVTGAGIDPTELDDATCSIGGESNSTWFKWRVKTTGTFVFTLTPSNPVDDLDFVLYELLNGLENCNIKISLRCMAAGEVENLYPSPCHGPTGLNFVETDILENAGCDQGQNNFLRFIVLEEGKSYALAVNNFTTFGNGFNITFGGTAEFEGPDAEIVLDKNEICIGEEVNAFGIVSDEVSNISGIDWTFGEGINPETGIGTGPFDLKYETPGEKYISIIVENDLGCRITKTRIVTVNEFPEFTSEVEQPDCHQSDNGSIEINTEVTGNNIKWSTGANGNVINELSPGIYFVTIEGGGSCLAINTFEIFEPDPPIIEADMATANCGSADGSLNIDVTGDFSPYQINWNDGGGFGNNFFRQNLSAGFYPVTIRGNDGCLFDTTLTVSEYNLELDVNVEKVIDPTCIGFSDGAITLSILNSTGPFHIDWFGNGDFVPETSIQNLSAGEYRITVRDAQGCNAFIVITLKDPPALQINISKDQPSCYNSTDGNIEVDVVDGMGPFQYRWVGGINGKFRSNIQGGNYNLTITDANGCPFEYNISLETPDSLHIRNLAISDVLCFGEMTGQIIFEGEGGSGGYEYSIDGQNFIGTGEFDFLKSGEYEIIVRDSEGCIRSEIVEIFQPNSPLFVDLGEDITIDLGDEATLNSIFGPGGRVVTYLWSPLDSLDCDTCPRVRANPTSTTTYYLTITDQDGCTATDSITIFVEKNRRVFVPNVFSPNFDGYNDFFTAYADKEAREIAQMSIFNRWGALIYDKKKFLPNDEFLGWDGTFKGQKVGMGTYVYVIRILFIDNETIEYSGDINVVW